jgi:hypothetical protein
MRAWGRETNGVVKVQRLLYLLAAALVLAGCARWPDSYPIPEQRKPILKRSVTMIAMDDPDAEDYIVKDIAPASKGIYWRWSYDRPELVIQLKQTANLRAAIDFSIVAETLKTTGPVTVTLFVNGNAIVSKRYKVPADYHLEAPVAAGLAAAPGAARLAVEARPIWVSPTDGQHLGIVLIRAGFL